MTPRLSGHFSIFGLVFYIWFGFLYLVWFSIFGLVFYVLKSIKGIARQWSGEKLQF